MKNESFFCKGTFVGYLDDGKINFVYTIIFPEFDKEIYFTETGFFSIGPGGLKMFDDKNAAFGCIRETFDELLNAIKTKTKTKNSTFIDFFEDYFDTEYKEILDYENVYAKQKKELRDFMIEKGVTKVIMDCSTQNFINIYGDCFDANLNQFGLGTVGCFEIGITEDSFYCYLI